VVVEFLKEGKTTLTVTSDDGQTATIRLIAISQEEYDRRQQTTVYSDSETTTTTTYTETTSVETSENQNSTTEETTSTVAATTETTVYTSTPESETTATSDSDLPQTGRNSLNQVAVVFSALLMISTGAWAMRSTGFLRHKDDET
jgi:ABC-type Na+ efflux pump permease subunit